VKGIEAQIEGWTGEPLSQMCNRLIYDGALLQVRLRALCVVAGWVLGGGGMGE